MGIEIKFYIISIINKVLGGNSDEEIKHFHVGIDSYNSWGM